MTDKSKTDCSKSRSPMLLKLPNGIQVTKVGVWNGDSFGLKTLRHVLSTFGLKHIIIPFISTEAAITATKQSEIDGLWVSQADKAIERCNVDDKLRFDNICAFKNYYGERIYHFFVRF